MEPIMKFLDAQELNVKISADATTRERLIQMLKNSCEMFNNSEGKMVTHCSLSIVSSELTVFLGYSNLQLITDLTDWFDCKRHWTYSTKNSGEDEIIGVWVNLLGATTPALIKSALPLDAIGGGLASRMIFIYANKKRGTIPAPFITHADKTLEGELQQDLGEISKMEGEFKLTESFITRWVDWYTEADKNPPFTDHILGAYCERRPTMVMKISMIISASRRSEMFITEDDLLTAISYLEEAETVMPNALSGIGKNIHADTLTRLMADISIAKKVSLDNLMWRYRYDVNKLELEQLIGSLEAMRFCHYSTNTRLIVYNDKFEGRL
jgi:hypothetical protein